MYLACSSFTLNIYAIHLKLNNTALECARLATERIDSHTSGYFIFNIYQSFQYSQEAKSVQRSNV